MLATVALILGCLTLTSWARPEVQTTVNPDRPCNRYDANGCSIPFGLPFFYKDQFTPSCDRHDICYLCGVGYDLTRHECDLAFRADTLATCSIDSSDQAELVLKATRELGFSGAQALLSEKVPELTNAMPYPGHPEFDNWFARRSNQVKIVADWVMKVADLTHHLGEGSDERDDKQKIEALLSELNQSPEVLAFRRNEPVQVISSDVKSMCTEVFDYLKSQGETPIVAGKPLTCATGEYIICDFFSELYYLGTSIFGLYGWSTTPEHYCDQAWVKECLPEE